MKIVVVLHGEKAEGLFGHCSIEIAANPPVTPNGMEQILELVPAIKAEGPYDAMYVSRMSRALGSASVLALALDLDFETMALLGQHANKEGSEVFFYPGHEGEGYGTWQRDGVAAIDKILKRHGPNANILVVSHRPIVGGLIAHTRGVTTEKGIYQITGDLRLDKRDFVVFQVFDGRIEVK